MNVKSLFRVMAASCAVRGGFTSSITKPSLAPQASPRLVLVLRISSSYCKQHVDAVDGSDLRTPVLLYSHRMQLGRTWARSSSFRGTVHASLSRLAALRCTEQPSFVRHMISHGCSMPVEISKVGALEVLHGYSRLTFCKAQQSASRGPPVAISTRPRRNRVLLLHASLRRLASKNRHASRQQEPTRHMYWS